MGTDALNFKVDLRYVHLLYWACMLPDPGVDGIDIEVNPTTDFYVRDAPL
jgi:hypothetical protein